MRLAHITIITALSTACSEPVVDLEGSVNGETVTGAAHWGGPHIVFTNSDMGCQEVDRVETSYVSPIRSLFGHQRASQPCRSPSGHPTSLRARPPSRQPRHPPTLVPPERRW